MMLSHLAVIVTKAMMINSESNFNSINMSPNPVHNILMWG